jgi:hypothetical protein
MQKKLPVNCPSCESPLAVSRLSCSSCDTGITGEYSLPILLQLSTDDQDFIFEFIRSSGSLKKMAVKTGKSYPTVRNKLDDIIEHINQLKKAQ